MTGELERHFAKKKKINKLVKKKFKAYKTTDRFPLKQKSVVGRALG